MSYTRTEGRPQRDSIIPRFHIEAVEDPVASAREGRLIYKNEERIQFLLPGSPNQPVERVTDEHRQRWPEQYAAFVRGEKMTTEGTPLEMWPVLKPAQVHELKALEIHSVEQCAGLPDSLIQRIQFGPRLKQLAIAYLDDAAALALTSKQAAQIEAQNTQIAELSQKVTELSSLVERLHSQHIATLERPSYVDTYVPGDHDMTVARNLPPEPAAHSSLGDLPEPRRRGRPTNAERDARLQGGV